MPRKLLILLIACATAYPLTGVARAADCKGSANDRRTSYQLSYVEADRAMALLELFGVPVVKSKPTGKATAVTGFSYTASTLPDVRPVVIQLVDAGSTGLVQSDDSAAGFGAATKLGGRPLDSITSGVPQQNLLIVWSEACPDDFQNLLSLLHDHIDVPAKQILIEALVIELDSDRVKDLGFSYKGKKDGNDAQFGNVDGGSFTPFTYIFNRPAAKTLLEFTGTLTALVDDGKATVLSRPSVLVLDGRQARIQVGDQVPYTAQATSTTALVPQAIVTGTSYLEVGIVLNLRPRSSDDNSEVTMQVETLISSAGPSAVSPISGALIGPPIQSRQVQTIVRVANNTPFIIGGLISRSNREDRVGIPVLSKIPGLGALFRRTNKSRTRKEVIVVITPHVIPAEDRSFSYSTAKDSDLFDDFDLELFRNVYRVRSDDVWDLDFIAESKFYQCLQSTAESGASALAEKLRDSGRTPVAPTNRIALAEALREWKEAPAAPGETDPPSYLTEQYLGLLEGRVPGEDVFVKRMLLEIIRNLGYAQYVDEDSLIYFKRSGTSFLNVESLASSLQPLDRSCTTLEMRFKSEAGATSGLPLDFPTAAISDPYPILDGDSPDAYMKRLRACNCLDADGGSWDHLAILLNNCFEWGGSSRQGSRDLLRNVVVLKRVLDLNPSLPLTLEAFHTGREVVFPTQEDLRNRRHLVDRETAQLFFETLDSYYAFEQTILRALGTVVGLKNVADAPPVPRGCQPSDLAAQIGARRVPCACPGMTADLGPPPDPLAPLEAELASRADEAAPAPRVTIQVDYTPATEPAAGSTTPPAAGTLADAVSGPLPPPGKASHLVVPDGKR